MKAKRGGSSDTSDMRTRIMEATARIMIEDGYAAVSARRVATRAGIKPALLQHYYPTMDALFLALYRGAADAVADRQTKALSSANPLQELWKLNADSKRTTLAIEFMALANHRKEIKAEIAAYNERGRKAQADALAVLLEGKLEDPDRYSPKVVSLLIAAVARALIMEEALGITSGHKEMRAVVNHWLKDLEQRPPSKAKSRRPRRA